MESETLAQERQQLQSLLDQYSEEAKTLPNLSDTVSPTWLESLQHQFQEWLQDLWDWLRELANPLPSIDLEADWTSRLQPLWWLGLALIIGWLIYSLAKKVKWLNPDQRALGFSSQWVSAEEQLGQTLATAIAVEDWALAARLRWRLFLSRMRCQAHLTPYEFFGEPERHQHWKHLEGTPLQEQYEVMFAATEVSPQWYEAYHRVLSRLEHGEFGHG